MNLKWQWPSNLPLKNTFALLQFFFICMLLPQGVQAVSFKLVKRFKITLGSSYLRYIDASCIATFSALLDDPQPKQLTLQSLDHNEQKPHHLKYMKKNL